MTTGSDLEGVKAAAGEGFDWGAPVALPGGDDRIVALGQRKTSSPV
jgi:hypothetical protein